MQIVKNNFNNLNTNGWYQGLILVNIRIEYVYLHCPTVFQIFIVLSILQEAICLLSAENEHDNIEVKGLKLKLIN